MFFSLIVNDRLYSGQLGVIYLGVIEHGQVVKARRYF